MRFRHSFSSIKLSWIFRILFLHPATSSMNSLDTSSQLRCWRREVKQSKWRVDKLFVNFISWRILDELLTILSCFRQRSSKLHQSWFEKYVMKSISKKINAKCEAKRINWMTRFCKHFWVLSSANLFIYTFESWFLRLSPPSKSLPPIPCDALRGASSATDDATAALV